MSDVDVKWRRFDYGDKKGTAPKNSEIVWIVEEFYTEGNVGLGYFDGYTFRMSGGSDDCSVSWWAPIEYPDPPPEAAEKERIRRRISGLPDASINVTLKSDDTDE